MMRTSTAILLSVALLILFSGCSGDGGTSPGPAGEHRVIRVSEHAAALQDSLSLLLEDLLGVLSEAAAKDSIATLFMADSMVVSVDTTAQGILVSYEEGLGGGIIIDFLDGGPGPDRLPQYTPGAAVSDTPDRNPLDGVIPSSSRTVMLVPLYSQYPEFEQLYSQLHGYVSGWFSRTDFLPPELFTNEQTTVHRFANLTDYGIVFIASHGIAVPGGRGTQRVYFMSGESCSPETNRDYVEDLASGHLWCANVVGGGSVYVFDSEWFSSHNAFSNDALIFAQVCYSHEAGWPTNVGGQAGLGAYVGFEDAAVILWGADCAAEVFSRMTDTALADPLTIQGWYDNPIPGGTPREFNGSHIRYTGDDDLTLWEEEGLCEDFPPEPGETRTYRTMDGSYTFSVFTQAVSELVGGYEVYRGWRSDNPPGLGGYVGCNEQHGEVDVATDWWDISDPSHNGRYYWVPPLYYSQYGDAVGQSCVWSGTFGGSPEQNITEVLAYEDVAVPAGSFLQAMKVRLTSYSNGNPYDDFYAWLHPTAGLVKAEDIDGGSGIVLISYSGARKSASSRCGASPYSILRLALGNKDRLHGK
jgi:hypothetical protein